MATLGLWRRPSPSWSIPTAVPALLPPLRGATIPLLRTAQVDPLEEAGRVVEATMASGKDGNVMKRQKPRMLGAFVLVTRLGSHLLIINDFRFRWVFNTID